MLIEAVLVLAAKGRIEKEKKKEIKERHAQRCSEENRTNKTNQTVIK